MEEFEDGEEYLCAIGTTLSDVIDYYSVGIYRRGLFSFKNGSYSNTELDFRKALSNNITTVLKAKKISDIDF